MTNQSAGNGGCTRHGLRLNGKGRPSDHELHAALAIVDRSGLAGPLQTLIDNRTGRPRVLRNVRGVLAAFILNGSLRHHRARIIEVARHIDAMTDLQRALLGLECWNPRDGYSWLCRFLAWLADTLDAHHAVVIAGETIELDSAAFMHRLVWATVPDDMPTVRSVAVDGTAIQTWAALYGDPASASVEPDDDGQRRPAHMRSRKPRQKSSLRVQSIGADRKPRYTKDPDALVGQRSATNSRGAGPYIGYELHLAVATRHVTSTNGIDRVTLSHEVPQLILGASVVSANTHRGEAVLPTLKFIKCRMPTIDEVIVDGGYSLLSADRFFHPVRKAGYDVTFDVALHQRGTHPFAGEALLIDGGFYSPLLPRHLRGVDDHGNNAPFPLRGFQETRAERERLERPYNERAPYAFVRHQRPDGDGAIRLRCPFHAGRLRSRQVPASMRASHSVPFVHLDRSAGLCCTTKSGIITVSAADAVWWQRIPFGTTAFYQSYSRRQAAESANAAIKCQFVNIDDKFTNTFGLTKIRVLLSFTLAGYNLDRLEAFRRKHEAASACTRSPRRARRTGTWHTGAA